MAAIFGLKPDRLAMLQAALEKEASPAQYEEIEHFLKSRPTELLKHVEQAYRDDKVTVLEYEVVRAVKEQIDIAAAKARIKAKIQELRNGPR